MKKMTPLLILLLVISCSQEKKENNQEDQANKVKSELESSAKVVEKEFTEIEKELKNAEDKYNLALQEQEKVNTQYKRLMESIAKLQMGEWNEEDDSGNQEQYNSEREQLLAAVHTIEQQKRIYEQNKETLQSKISKLKETFGSLDAETKKMAEEELKRLERQEQENNSKKALLEEDKKRREQELQAKENIEHERLKAKDQTRKTQLLTLQGIIDGLEEEKKDIEKEFDLKLETEASPIRTEIAKLKEEIKKIETQVKHKSSENNYKASRYTSASQQNKELEEKILAEKEKNKKIDDWIDKHSDYINTIKNKRFVLDESASFYGLYINVKNGGSIQSKYIYWNRNNRSFTPDMYGNFMINSKSGQKIYFNLIKSENNEWNSKDVKGLYYVTENQPAVFEENDPRISNLPITRLYVRRGSNNKNAVIVFYADGGPLFLRYGYQK
ncbi:MAG: hypothetical protein ACRCVW_00270 [Brevinema sp.]